MNKIKAILPISILLGCLILGVFYFLIQEKKLNYQENVIVDTQSVSENVASASGVVKEKEDDLFSKKEKCKSYQEQIENNLKDDALITRNILDEIFYSPSEDSCLYSYMSVYLDSDGTIMDQQKMGRDYVIIDYLTNETVLYVNSKISTDAFGYFNETKRDLKK